MNGTKFTLAKFKEINNNSEKLQHFKTTFLREMDKVLLDRIKFEIKNVLAGIWRKSVDDNRENPLG